MRAKTFLEIHHALLNGEKLMEQNPDNGLCHVMIQDGELCDNEIFRLFIPKLSEAEQYNHWYGHWGDTLDTPVEILGTEYNEFRQTVILLCAAINGEL